MKFSKYHITKNDLVFHEHKWRAKLRRASARCGGRETCNLSQWRASRSLTGASGSKIRSKAFCFGRLWFSVHDVGMSVLGRFLMKFLKCHIRKKEMGSRKDFYQILKISQQKIK